MSILSGLSAGRRCNEPGRTLRLPACHQHRATSWMGALITACATRTTGSPPAVLCAASSTTPYTCCSNDNNGRAENQTHSYMLRERRTCS